MGLRPLEFFQRRYRLYTSESDVYRLQIPTYKESPLAEKVEEFDKDFVQLRRINLK